MKKTKAENWTHDYIHQFYQLFHLVLDGINIFCPEHLMVCGLQLDTAPHLVDGFVEQQVYKATQCVSSNCRPQAV